MSHYSLCDRKKGVCVCVCVCARVCVWQRNESTAWHTLSLQKPKTDVFVSSFPSFINQTILILELSAPSSSSLNKALKHSYTRTHTHHTHTHTLKGLLYSSSSSFFSSRASSLLTPPCIRPSSILQSPHLRCQPKVSLSSIPLQCLHCAVLILQSHVTTSLLSTPSLILSFLFLSSSALLYFSRLLLLFPSLSFPVLSSFTPLYPYLTLLCVLSSPLLSSPLLSWTAFLLLPADCFYLCHSYG